MHQLKLDWKKLLPLIPPAVTKLKISGLAFFRRRSPVILGAILGLLVSYLTYTYVTSPNPTITLQVPAGDQEVKSENLFVKGIVAPIGSKVRVNGQEVAENGDGTFTTVINIPEGKSTLKIEANYRGKNAEVIHLINRLLTEEEQKTKDEQKRRAQLKDKEDVLGIDQKIDELIVAYNNKTGSDIVRVLDHKVNEKAGFRSVSGEVINGAKEDVYWVKVTANFYDEHDSLVDTKIGFAVALDQYLKPGDKGTFDSQSTSKEFSYYKLSVEWKKGSDLGGAQSQEEAEAATKSAEKTPQPSPKK
ncbi:hypothetical protein HYW46_01065 [Candidatus Daviesbacteria bacterium]|nr:hypothetical protein [Candidatus Daviesbacteria bacterium]